MDDRRRWTLGASEVERHPEAIVALREAPGLMPAPHWHTQAEVNFVLAGHLEYRMQGFRARLGVGELALFWGGLPHQVVDTAPGTLFHVVHLPLLHFFRLRLDRALQGRLMAGAMLVTDEGRDEDRLAFARWDAFLGSGDPRRVGHAVDEMLLRLERVALGPHRLVEAGGRGARGAPADPPTMEAIRRICAYVAANFREEIACADIAASAGLHPKYAMTVFRKATGLSLLEYLSLLRVSYAQALLAAEGATVLEVALDAGFGSLSAFNKCFRKRAGMTPSEFKRGHRLPVPTAA